MVEGFIVTILTAIIVVWTGFSMVGRDEARVSTHTGLSKWYKNKTKGTITEMEKVLLDRDYVSLKGRGVHTQNGYKITLKYKDQAGLERSSSHYFYDESRQDEEFLGKYIKDDQLALWLTDKNEVYVPGESVNEREILTIFGADKVMVYTLAIALVAGLISSLFIIFINFWWLIIHLPVILLSSIIPQGYMYMQEMWGTIEQKDYKSVGAVSQYALYEDEREKGINKIKLVEQTLPMVELEEEVGYLGYQEGRVPVLVNYDGDIPVHISSEYRTPDLIRSLIKQVIDKEG